MGQIEGGKKVQSQGSTHIGQGVSQPKKESQVPTGNAGAGSIKPQSPNKTTASGKQKVGASSTTQQGQGQERLGHKYIKREWSPKSKKWEYTYADETGNKYHSYDKLHHDSVKPEIDDDLSHVKLAKHHHESEIKNLKDLHSSSKNEDEKKEILDKIKQHKENFREMEDKEIELMADPKYADQKFDDIKDTPGFKQKIINIMDRLADSISKRYGSDAHIEKLEKLGMKKLKRTRDVTVEYIDTLLWQERHTPKEPMSKKVSIAEKQAKERYRILKIEEDNQKKWGKVINDEFDDVTIETEKNKINKVKNELKDSYSEKYDDFKKHFDGLATKLNKVLQIEDIKGILIDKKETARAMTFYIRANQNTKPSILEKHLDSIKKQISYALKVSKERIQIIKGGEGVDSQTLVICIPKNEHKFVIGMKPYLNSVIKQYSSNPVKNPFVLGANIDINDKQLKEGLNIVSLTESNSHVICGGITGAGKTNTILCDIITQKALGRKVKSFIIDPLGGALYKEVSDSMSNVHFLNNIDSVRHPLKALSKEIKKRKEMPFDKRPKEGFQEIRLYVDELNRLFEELNKTKRSITEKNELSTEELIRSIAREGREANIHIITFGQSTRLEDIPADLRDNALKIAIYANGVQLPGLPNGQQYLTAKGHNIAFDGEKPLESISPKVDNEDLALITGKKQQDMADEQVDTQNSDVENEQAKVKSDGSDVISNENIIKNPEDLAMLYANSQVALINDGEDPNKVVAEDKTEDWLKEAVNRKGVKKNFDKNNLVINFGKRTENIKTGKQKPDGATLAIMKNISKHPDPKFSKPAKEAAKAIEDELKNAPHLKELDAAPGLVSYPGNKELSKRGRPAGSKNKQKDAAPKFEIKDKNKINTEKDITNNSENKPVEENIDKNKDAENIFRAPDNALQGRYTDLQEYVKNNKNESTESAMNHLASKFYEYDLKNILTELNNNKFYQEQSKSKKNEILKQIEDQTFNNYIHINLNNLKNSGIKNNLSNSINNDFPSDHKIHSFNSESIKNNISDLLKGESESIKPVENIKKENTELPQKTDKKENKKEKQTNTSPEPNIPSELKANSEKPNNAIKKENIKPKQQNIDNQGKGPINKPKQEPVVANSAGKNPQTWQDILNEPESFDNEDVVSMSDINDEGKINKESEVQTQTKQEGKQNKENKQDKVKKETIQPQEYRGLSIEPTENGVGVRHPEDDYHLAEFDNLADAKKYSDHLANRSDVSDKKKFDKDIFNLHTDAMNQVKKIK